MKWFIHQRERIEQPKTELVSIKNVVGHQGQTIHCLERPHEPTKTLELNNLIYVLLLTERISSL